MDIADRIKLVKEVREYDCKNHLEVTTTTIESIKEGKDLTVRVSLSGMSMDYTKVEKDMFEHVVRTHVLSTWPAYKLGMGKEIVDAIKLQLSKKLFNF